jgi:hypothetical protein
VNTHNTKEDNSTGNISRKNSLNSNSLFDELNTEIKAYMENHSNDSFSNNSDSENKEEQDDIEYLLDSKYWKDNKPENQDEDFSEKDENIPIKKSALSLKNIDKFKKKNISFSTTDRSNKQMTQSNEEDEVRNDKIRLTSDTESPLNSLMNNESSEMEFKSNKSSPYKEEKEDEKNQKNIFFQSSDNLYQKFDDKNIFDQNFQKNNDIYTFKDSNKDYISQGFVYPYNQMNTFSKNNNPTFYSSPFLAHQLFNQNSNLITSLNKRGMISMKNDNDMEEIGKKENEFNINGQNFYKLKNIYGGNMNNKKMSLSQKNLIELPIISQNLGQNMLNFPKINQNFNFFQKSPNMNLNNKQENEKDTTLPELNKCINKKDSNCDDDKKLKINKNNNKYNLKGEKQVLNLNDIASGKDQRTTVMIRNIPIKYSEKMLNDALEEFQKKYDCLNMPYDYDKNGNKGYAFINFVNPLHILLFYEKFNGKKWKYFESAKICELNCAHFQGINELQKHTKNFKDIKKNCYKENENVVVPSKYLSILKTRFPKLTYSENKTKKLITIKSFD